MEQMTLQAVCNACGGTYSGPFEMLGKEISGIAIDSRKIQSGWLFAATVGERVDGHSFIPSCYEKGALACLGEKPPVSDGLPYIQVASTFQALKDIAEFYRSTLQIPIVGITGSVGKTSTKEMVASVLGVRFRTLKTEGNFNNEVGLPLTVFNIRPQHEAAVLEMGISDFGEMHRLSKIARPDICVITNIGQCHLEFLGDRDGVLRAKSEIFDFAAPDAKVFVNGDDDKLRTLKNRTDLSVTTFGVGEDNDIRASRIEDLGLNGSRCEISTPDGAFPVHIHIPGLHMVHNALAGTCVGLALGLTTDEIRQGIEAAQTISGRNNLIRSGSYTIMDDCYNANPVSMKASLDVLASASGRKVAILGDMGELGEEERPLHFDIGVYAAQKGIDLLICLGTLAEEICRGAKSADPSINTLHFDTKEELIGQLPALLRSDDSILVKASHFMDFGKIVTAIQKNAIS